MNNGYTECLPCSARVGRERLCSVRVEEIREEMQKLKAAVVLRRTVSEQQKLKLVFIAWLFSRMDDLRWPFLNKQAVRFDLWLVDKELEVEVWTNELGLGKLVAFHYPMGLRYSP